MASSTASGSAIHWFRKGLRLHDNPALLEACRRSSIVYPVFCMDPHFAKPDTVGVNRYSFLLESLRDLDSSLRVLGSQLYVLQGKPADLLPSYAKKWGVDLITFESDSEPYARTRDAQVTHLLEEQGVAVREFCSHTIHSPEAYLAKGGGKAPSVYGSFGKLFASMGPVRADLPPPTDMFIAGMGAGDPAYNVPTLKDLGYADALEELDNQRALVGSGKVTKYAGGETEALKRLQEMVADKSRAAWVLAFEKPSTSPNALTPSTTVLSPYLKFGCLSPAKFYHELDRIYAANKGKGSQPPMSLHGQLLWREFFYLSSVATPNFDKMQGNPRCKQIPWQRDAHKLELWKMGRTGFPFIDAIMTQLRLEGWIHHLARHSTACFLTRGDLWQHWEEGAKVFDLYLLDGDWALNNANWQWLSASNFFYQYYRVYSPVAFGKKTDPNGDYIRMWIPQLANFPAKYIYEPWKAPRTVQEAAHCIVGQDYPMPMIDHDSARDENLASMKAAYAAQGGAEKVEDAPSKGQKRKATK
mmetsp:Transcript_20103/g.44692  ORF Transcript_20103/g.44692 Transcript_20103/m.44692 type:complete len:528 (-) Transcript_20103:69-1652(-)